MDTTLQELYLEGGSFLFRAEFELEDMLASEPMEEQVEGFEGDSWLLCECPSPLERIDLKGIEGHMRSILPIPQRALVNLVRHSRHLKWFHSDLSEENIA
jgi:hypothetical protein